ncbi:hypothetical protein BS50DRAFT_569176 [Corynespora cassiicola Philippines]|uniref:Uncharacterized protein n=1 Tax=Corynespora cassiicola Philippines TaxID=1448308 RepID=A0A2T2P7P1_CORCC|nr:hypothetical protein BS50DRAFT_569176 [Corynespora cassiicola Philippines]
MPASTRTQNKDANFKVYYSKKPPKQQHFPHRRKVVRHKDAEPSTEKKQLQFLPEKMRKSGIVQDSEDEDIDAGLEDGGVEITPEPESEEPKPTKSAGRKPRTRGKKRDSDVIQGPPESEGEVSAFSPKRRRKTPAVKRAGRSKKIAAPSSDDERASEPEEPEPDTESKRRRRRQSTMTQLVDGRRPLPDVKSPRFKRVRSGPRTSWSGKTKDETKDAKQRTLTQMIPGITPLGIVSDDDLEEEWAELEAQENEDSQEWNKGLTRRLAEQGLYQPADTHDRDEEEAPTSGQEGPSDADVDGAATPMPIPTIEVDADADDEKDAGDVYQPTQFIDAPILKQRHSSRRVSGKGIQGQKHPASNTAASKERKTRFDLLATPEKRRIREIPSSQSPPESPLLTQVSPLKAARVALKLQSGNSVKVPDTPSKKKQVTFQEPQKESAPRKRRFDDVIRDSEDEDEDIIEDVPVDRGREADREMRALAGNIDTTNISKSIGEETQSMSEEIDRECDVPEDQEVYRYQREISEELGQPLHHDEETDAEHDTNLKQEPGSAEHSATYRSVHPGIKQEASQMNMSDLPSQPGASYEQLSMGDGQDERNPFEDSAFGNAHNRLRSSPPIINMRAKHDGTTPEKAVVKEESSDSEQEEAAPTPSHSPHHPCPESISKPPPATMDLDESIQVPRSPQHETQESHSSRAEQQLQAEWNTYSQCHKGHALPTSSMRVIQDAFSYQNTPYPPRPPLPPHHSGPLSQATTVDPSQASPKTTPHTTPRKARSRSQPIPSAHTTPHKSPTVSEIFPFDSAQRPPPLFIPSSFPSPEKGGMGEWSSPMMDRRASGWGFGASQFDVGASVEDFSIPAPPPAFEDEVEDEIVDDEEL